MKGRILLSAVCISLLSGCGWLTPKPVYITPDPLRCQAPELSMLVLTEVEWLVLTEEDGAFFALASVDYVRLSQNSINTLEWVKGKQSQLGYYKSCIATYNAALARLAKREKEGD